MNAARKTARILWREYVAHVRTKSFLIGVLLTPVIVGVMILVPVLLERTEAGVERTLLLWDADPDLNDRVVEGLQRLYEAAPGADSGDDMTIRRVEPEAGETPDQAADRLDRMVRDGDAFAWAVIEPGVTALPDAGDDPDEPGVLYGSIQLTHMTLKQRLRQAVREAVLPDRYAEAGVERDTVRRITRTIPFRERKEAEEGGGTEEVAQVETVTSFILPMAFVYLLSMGVLAVGQTLLTSVIEEKSNRIVEVLLSSCTPVQLMVGKVLGIQAMGLTLFGLWFAGGAVVIVVQGLTGFVPAHMVVVFFAYYILGFLLYSALMAAVGSACNTLKEAQNLVAPVNLLLFIPFMMAFWVTENPDAFMVKVLTWFPPFTPFIMVNRLAIEPGPAAWEVVGSIVLMIASVAVAFWAAGRIFRVGVLMTGKPPRLRDLLRWLRTA